jgi:lysophospholipase L1-like esterase
MLRTTLTLLLLSLFAQMPAFAQQAAPATEPAALPAPLKTLELQDGDSIVFLGDSITHQCLYTQYVEDYFYTRFPKMRLKIHNAGVGGARAWDALQRFDDDVAAYKPKYVTILLGMNDGTYRPYDEAIFQTYRADMTQLLDKLHGIGATAIPMTPTMYDSRAKRLYGKPGWDENSITLYNSVLAYYGTWLREASYERGLGFVDMWSRLNNITLEERKSDPKFTMIRDAVHPGPDGQVVMAVSIVEDLDLQRLVSNVTMQKNAQGKWVAKGQRAEVSEVTETDGGLTFTVTEESLPWVLPADAQLGVKLTKLGHHLSREALQISGLPAGRYSLSIDGTEVGTFGSAQLGSHIELQANEKTPQYQQALKVAELNKQRNDGPVHALRGEWSKFQQYARQRRTVEQNPTDEKAKQGLAGMEKKMEGLADRVAQHNAAAKELEDQIFAINQPQPRHYELKKVK